MSGVFIVIGESGLIELGKSDTTRFSDKRRLRHLAQQCKCFRMSYQHPVPKNLLTCIGDMTVSFAMLELHMQLLFVSLVNQSARVGHILASQLTFSRLRASIISLYKERFGENVHFPELKTLMARAGKIEEERNLITHSIWGAGEKAGSITRIKITAREKRGYHAEFKEYDEQMFTEFVEAIKKLTADVFIFYVERVPQNEEKAEPT